MFLFGLVWGAFGLGFIGGLVGGVFCLVCCCGGCEFCGGFFVGGGGGEVVLVFVLVVVVFFSYRLCHVATKNDNSPPGAIKEKP